MSPIAGQTAGSIGLKFFVDTHGWPCGVLGLKKFEIFFEFVFPRATPGPSAVYLIFVQFLLYVYGIFRYLLPTINERFWF